MLIYLIIYQVLTKVCLSSMSITTDIVSEVHPVK